eukprot:m.357114 g.357114  ORF g.357114 m.357114 type:complete len:364 (+) comp17707_c0_seq1:195-1286(+)
MSVYQMKLLGGSSGSTLLDAVSGHLGRPLVKAEVQKFANSETRVAICESVRDADVYVVQTGYGGKTANGSATTLNDSCMELFIMASGCRLASANRIYAVLPYFPYSKQSKQKKRGTIPARLIADMLKVSGFTGVITLDLHHMQMQGFFSIPINNVKSSPLIVDYIKKRVENYQGCVVLAKNAGASKRAALIAKRLKIDFAIIIGESTKFAELLSEERLDGDGSEAAAQIERLASHADAQCETPEDEDVQGDGLLGNVSGRDVIIVDDLLDSAEPFLSAVSLLTKAGAGRIYVVCTHGIFSGHACTQLMACDAVTRVAVTNSIPQDENIKVCPKIDVIDCSQVIAETIRRVHHNESLFSLYTPT